MAQPTILQAGSKVGGKYEVVEVIGFGGMGVVYKVRELVGAVSRIRALKTVLPQFMNDAAVVRRFREEAEKMCLLEHENIVPVLAYSEEGEFPFLVMPFLEGQTLKEYLAAQVAQTGRPLPLAEVVEIGIELVRGLEVAHHFVSPETGRSQPMVHRDIKPGNVMVRAEERDGERRLRVLIMDFGIAKVLSDEDTGGHTLTDVIGTVRYASPEQIRRQKDIDPRADIYSLGHLLFELYTGRHLFAALSEHAVLMRMMQKELAESDVEFPPATPESFRQLIRRAVAVDRDRRFQDVSEMRALLREILEEQGRQEVQAAESALAAARTGRQRAVDAEAATHAADAFAAGDSALAGGEAALEAGRYGEAHAAFAAAAEAFARAAAAAETERSERRERERRAATAARRALASALDAERLLHDALPAPLRSAAGAAELATAIRSATEADTALGRSAFTEAEGIALAGRAAVSRAAELRAEAVRADAEARAVRNREARPAAESALARLAAERGNVQALPLAPDERVRFEHAVAEGRRAEADAAAGEFAAAEPAAERAAAALSEIAAEAAERIERERRAAERDAAERAARAARLAELSEQHARAATRLGAVPSLRPLRRDRRAADTALARAAQALASERDDEATIALGSVAPFLVTLENRAAEIAAAKLAPRPPRAGPSAVQLGAGLGTAAVLGAGLVYYATREKPPVPGRVEPTPALARRADATSPPAAGGLSALRSSSIAEPTAASIAGPSPIALPLATAALPAPTTVPQAVPTLAVAIREAPPTAVPTTAPAPTVPLVAIASVKPLPGALSVTIGSEPRFEAALERGSADDLRWELDGKPVGRGRQLKVARSATQTPGRHRLALLAAKSTAPLRSWTIEVTAPPLRFATLEPGSRALERPSGARVPFRASLDLADTQGTVFAWEVNGKAVAAARGPSYDFQAAEPGDYAVQVRATAPWGDTIANRWSVTVRPKPAPVPTVARTEPETPRSPDPQAWIRDYCSAFERKDTGKLIELGHLSNEAEAARLRDALAPLQDLRLSCTNASVQMKGDEATVGFDRTDRWRDPRGGEVEKVLPRISKRLRLRGGRWVAAP